MSHPSADRTSCSDPAAGAGVAIGATYIGHDPALLELMLPHVDYLEVTLETIAKIDGERITLSADVMSELKTAQQRVKIIVHGITLSLGSHEGWSPNYFQLMDQFLDQVDVAWHSEHLGYTKVDGAELGLMLAMPKTDAALDMLSERICTIQRLYHMPLLIENIVHVIPDYAGEFSDAQFLNALTDNTGCGLLLDLYNLECDAHNIGFDIPAFMNELNHAPVRELHLARGVERNGFLLDVHSRLTQPSTVELARQALTCPHSSAEVAVFEFLAEAVPGLGHQDIVNELVRLRARLGH